MGIAINFLFVFNISRFVCRVNGANVIPYNTISAIGVDFLWVFGTLTEVWET